MRQPQTILFTNILCVSIGLKLICYTDVVYNTTGAQATEVFFLDAHLRRFSQSQHTRLANQSEPIVYI